MIPPARKLAIAVLCATGALILLSVMVEQAHCAELDLSVGPSTSVGWGEEPVSPQARLRLALGRVDVAASYERAYKLETGAGWIGGLDFDVQAWGPVILGADWRNRNGGPWTKRVVFARAGLTLGRVTRVIYRHEVYSTALVPNRARILEIRSRYAVSRSLFVESALGVGTFEEGGRRVGPSVYGKMGFGGAWGRR